MARVRDSLARRLGASLIRAEAEAAAEAAVAPLRAELDKAKKLVEALGPIDPDEHLYRAEGQQVRNLPSYTAAQVIEVAYELHERNPLGHRILELTRDFVVGDGITWSARNPDVEEIVRAFWDDGSNDLSQRSQDFALELGLYGELIPEAFTGAVSGIVQLGYVDPADVKKVSSLDDGDVRNPLILDKVVIKRKGSGISGKSLDIIREREGGRLAGDVFFFRVNGVSNSTRGRSDLLPIADWLDAYDQLLWEILERARLIRTFIWDVVVKGDQAAVDRFKAQNSAPPRSGSVRFHNDEVAWSAVSPQLGSYETAKEAEVILEHISAGAGLPKTWLSSADDVNRATAQTMDVPTVRRLQRRQTYFLGCLRLMLRYALEQAEDAGTLKTTDGKVQVFDEEGNPAQESDGSPKMMAPIDVVQLHAPEISTKDLNLGATVLKTVAEVLAVAESQGWLGTETARQALAVAFAQLGIEFDPASVVDEDDEGQDGAKETPPPEGEPTPPKTGEDLEEALRAYTG